MKDKYIVDMTQGKIIPLLLNFTIPMLFGNLFQQLYNLADSVIVGNYVGPNALGAVGACGSLNFFFFSMCSGMSLGIGILISQYFGAREDQAIRKTIWNGFAVITAVAILMGTLGFCLARPVLAFLDTPEVYIEDSILYMRTTTAGILGTALYNGVSAMLRALGDSRTPLKFLVVASVVNVGLDLFFVLFLHMGVFGVAAATVISQMISAAGCILFAFWKNPYFKFERKENYLDFGIMKKCFLLGIPIGLQSSMIAVSNVALQRAANGFGPDVATAYTMSVRLEQLIGQPYSSLAAAMSTFTGQNTGAGQISRVRKGLRQSLVIIGIFSLLMLIIMQLFGGNIMRIFGDDEKILAIAANAVKITSICYFPLGVIYAIRALCNGAGDTGYALMNGIVEVICRIGFSVCLTAIPEIGMWGIWMTTGCTWTVTGIASVMRYKTEKWMKKCRVSSAVSQNAGGK